MVKLHGLTSFQRCIDARADENELVYISALHQTSPTLRMDCSIDAEDIQAMLISRYGISVTIQQINDTIIKCFGGDDGGGDKTTTTPTGGDDGEKNQKEEETAAAGVIDIAEMAAMLIIPLLLKLEKQSGPTSSESVRQFNKFQGLGKYRSFLSFNRYEKQEQIKKDLEPSEDVSDHLISDMLTFMLKNAGIRTDPPPILNRQLIRKLLDTYNEKNIISDDDTIDKMLKAVTTVAGDDLGDDHVIFDEQSFLRALTHDVKLYDTRNETKLTTNFYDVFHTYNESRFQEGEAAQLTLNLVDKTKNVLNVNSGTSNEGSTSEFEIDQQQQQQQGSEELGEEQVTNSNITTTQQMSNIKTVFTAPSIDYTADTYRSKALTVTLYIFTLMTFITYFIPLYQMNEAFNFCGDETRASLVRFDDEEDSISSSGFFGSVANAGFDCYFFQSIFDWFVTAIIYSVTGLIVIITCSVGNWLRDSGDDSKKFFIPWALALLLLTILALIPFAVRQGRGTSNDVELYLVVVTFCLGVFLIVIQMSQIFGQIWWAKIIAQRTREIPSVISQYFTPSAATDEAGIKQAAMYKINRLASNALAIHKNFGKEHGSGEIGVILDYDKHGAEKTEIIGGLFWTYKHIFWTGSLQNREGIWYHSRLIIGNVLQVIVTILVPLAAALVTAEVSKFIHQQVDNLRLDGALSRLGNVELSFINSEINSLNELLDTLDDAADAILEAGFVGAIIAFIACIGVSILYLPSITRVMLLMRSGKIATLYDTRFQKLRVAQDSVSQIVGAMMFGTIWSGLLVYVAIAFVSFFFLWNQTRYFAVRQCANIVGFCVIIVLKIAILSVTRLNFYKGLYRKRPAAANVTTLALECVNIALSYGYMFLRALTLIAISLIYTARIDVPVLGEGVGELGPIDLDRFPAIFQRDLISHEAHRHPYLESLGVIYMMKLRHGDAFGATSGSLWRLLFVYALMPWLRKYRENDFMMTDNEVGGLKRISSSFRTLQTRSSTRYGANAFYQPRLEGDEEAYAVAHGGRRADEGIAPTNPNARADSFGHGGEEVLYDESGRKKRVTFSNDGDQTQYIHEAHDGLESRQPNPRLASLHAFVDSDGPSGSFTHSTREGPIDDSNSDNDGGCLSGDKKRWVKLAIVIAIILILMIPLSLTALGSGSGDDCNSAELSPFILRLSATAARLSQAAYNDPTNESSPFFVQNVMYYLDEPNAALVANVDNQCFVAFRGTTPTPLDWLTNLNIRDRQVCSQDEGCCSARAGFVNNHLDAPFTTNLTMAVRACKQFCSTTVVRGETLPDESCRVIITGHSQGGAIASVASVTLEDLDPITITFGQPSTLHPECQSVINPSNHYRWINTDLTQEGNVAGFTVIDSNLVYDPVVYSPEIGSEHYGHAIVINNSTRSVVYYPPGVELPVQPVQQSFTNNFTLLDGDFSAHMIGTYSSRVEGLSLSNNNNICTDGFENGFPCNDNTECASGNCERNVCSS